MVESGQPGGKFWRPTFTTYHHQPSRNQSRGGDGRSGALALPLSSHRFVSTTTCGRKEGRKRGKWQAASWTDRFFPQLPGFARAAWKNEQANRRGEEEVMNGAAFGSTTRSRSRGPFRNADADQVKRRRRRFQMMPHLILLVAPSLLWRWPKLGKSLRRRTFSCNFPIITRLY